ncbi:hypothetical protein LG201_13120 [Methylobacillus gramineus]|uniref:hypothetical protein n=1 Tax=Methylobacillus gramineus TaxID=755169 RepID=UPI001CFFDCEB|nr:hypothetical protein [Methylobacillus gramineus]MCB5186149.1 hypothetical protein [Methylobacillus gramineus]
MILTEEQEFAKAEAKKLRKFEKKRVCFEQNSEHLRSLNGLMWQVPLIAMTLTGGLWFGIAQLNPNKTVVMGVLILAAATNFGLIFVMLRMRYIFSQILLKTKEFYPTGIANTTGHCFLKNWLVVFIFSLLLLYASISSLVGAMNVDYLLYNNNNNEEGKKSVKESVKVNLKEIKSEVCK